MSMAIGKGIIIQSNKMIFLSGIHKEAILRHVYVSSKSFIVRPSSSVTRFGEISPLWKIS